MRGSHRRSICGSSRGDCAALDVRGCPAGTRPPAGKPQNRQPTPLRGTGAPEKWSADGAAVGLCRARAHRRTAVCDGCAGNGCSTAWQRVRLRQLGIGFLLDCMKQIVQDLPIDMEMVLRQTLRAIPDLTRTERQQFCTILRKKLYSETVYSALLDHITATGEGLTVHLHGVSGTAAFRPFGQRKTVRAAHGRLNAIRFFFPRSS